MAVRWQGVENPEKNYFKVHKNVYFNTGIFSINTQIWKAYVTKTKPEFLANHKISIEHHLLKYFKENKIPYEDVILGIAWLKDGENYTEF